MPNDATDHNPLQKSRWLAFDAVGTLIDPFPAVADAYHAVGSQFGTRFSVAEVDQRFRAAFRSSEANGFPGSSAMGPWATSDDVERARWRWIVEDVFPDVDDVDTCFLHLWEHFARPTSWRCFEDAGETLAHLSSRGYRLAIASNFDCRLHPVCDGLRGLGPIELRLVSAAVGYRKPAPEFYGALIEACRCRAEEIVMIGDDFNHDVAAARAAGLQAIHLNRKAPAGGPGMISSLQELVQQFSDPPC